MSKRRKWLLWLGLILSFPASGYAGLCVVFYSWLNAANPERWPAAKGGLWAGVSLLFAARVGRNSGPPRIAPNGRYFETEQSSIRLGQYKDFSCYCDFMICWSGTSKRYAPRCVMFETIGRFIVNYGVYPIKLGWRRIEMRSWRRRKGLLEFTASCGAIRGGPLLRPTFAGYVLSLLT